MRGVVGWLALTNAIVPLEQLGVSAGPFLDRLMTVNFILRVFYLLPAFPKDGGRVYRAQLALEMEHSQ